MKDLKPNERRAKNAITLIWVILALEVASLISAYLQYNLLYTFENGGWVSPKSADVNDLRELVISITYMVMFIISAVFFIQWFRRAYFNLHLLVKPLSHTEGWAAGSWFVPIISLYRPFQIMKELYEETSAYLRIEGVVKNESFSTQFLSWWWALWILSNFLGQIIFRLPTETMDQLINATMVNIIAHIIGIPLALITIKVIKEYANMESLMKEVKTEEKQLNMAMSEVD